MKRPIICLVALALVSCSSASSGNSVATPVVTTAEAGTVMPDGVRTDPEPTPEPRLLVPAELKYRVLEEFPDFFFCDPDYYPIAREDEMILAQKRFPELQANHDQFQVILSHLGLVGFTTFTDDQTLAIYREHKKLNAINFEASGNKFKFQIQTGVEGQQGQVITATIDADGDINVLERQEGFPTCPICLAEGTLIATPRGAIRVEDLRVGESVWTANEAGERVEGLILRVGRVQVPSSHRMVHVRLSDGRELRASGGHPTADGRVFSNLQSGDVLDGAVIAEIEKIQYSDSFTYDLLPSGKTGFYWANGILIASTLNR